jgi:hypothetical protein
MAGTPAKPSTGRSAQQLADEAQMAAIMNQNDWDWGPWGWP